jgi:Ubiquitin family
MIPIAVYIVVQTLTGKRVKVPCTLSDTIDNIKKEVEVRGGVPFDQQRLIHAGKQLENESTLAGKVFLFAVHGRPRLTNLLSI